MYIWKKALTVEWQNGYSVVLNLTYGTLRQIPGDTEVTPVKPQLTIYPLSADELNKVLRLPY